MYESENREFEVALQLFITEFKLRSAWRSENVLSLEPVEPFAGAGVQLHIAPNFWNEYALRSEDERTTAAGNVLARLYLYEPRKSQRLAYVVMVGLDVFDAPAS